MLLYFRLDKFSLNQKYKKLLNPLLFFIEDAALDRFGVDFRNNSTKSVVSSVQYYGFSILFI